MASTTRHYKIHLTGPAPFADLDVHTDTPQFLDPYAIRLLGTPTPHAAKAINCLDTFLEELVLTALSSDPAVQARGAALPVFPEPRQTHLGLSARGINGHGGAEVIRRRIWKAMSTDLRPLLHVGVLRHLEELGFYIKDVGDDITSDITTRIIFQALVDFTQEMLALYPEFTANGHKTATVSCRMWNDHTRQWEMKSVTLPVANGAPLLLVPSGWVTRHPLMRYGRFFEVTMLGYIQDLHTQYTPEGKPLKTPKDLFVPQGLASRDKLEALRKTLEAYESGRDLLAEHRRFVTTKGIPPQVDLLA
ncbi:hypothetical protein DE149_1234 [Micrococcus sp. KT16]|uniref:hypothetical protein n=1 Tax=Micrococcus sp. KT16 TaxID=2184005 RepID=UPI000DE81ACB|nr:hypothetical protein [Micrococcus sp. KT16]RBO83055.1 hypothetical protein DE149_1234 [Micrococcus sp. KT16]